MQAALEAKDKEIAQLKAKVEQLQRQQLAQAKRHPEGGNSF